MYTLDGVRVRYDLKYNWEDTICIHVSHTVSIPLQVMWQSCDRVYGHMTCLDGNSLCRVVIYHRHWPFKHLNHQNRNTATIDLCSVYDHCTHMYTQTADTQIYVTIKQCWCHEDNVFPFIPHIHVHMYYHIMTSATLTWLSHDLYYSRWRLSCRGPSWSRRQRRAGGDSGGGERMESGTSASDAAVETLNEE